MIDSLYILNGVISPKFSSLNNTYTVSVTSDIMFLEFDYIAKDSYNVSYINNENFIEGENIVKLLVEDNFGNSEEYIFIVNKEKTGEVIVENSIINPIEVQVKEVPNFIGPLIGVIIFIILLLLYKILFIRKKKKTV